MPHAPRDLDGLGNANAFWVFQIPSALNAASGSMVSLINTGEDAGVFWNVGSSATLGSTTSFEGNILANTNITLITGAIMGCGGAYANTAAVNLDTNNISNGCGGGFSVSIPGGIATALPFVALNAVPEVQRSYPREGKHILQTVK
jgi:hypothetical protein